MKVEIVSNYTWLPTPLLIYLFMYYYEFLSFYNYTLRYTTHISTSNIYKLKRRTNFKTYCTTPPLYVEWIGNFVFILTTPFFIKIFKWV